VRVAEECVHCTFVEGILFVMECLLCQQRRREQIPCSYTDNTKMEDPKGRAPART